MSYHFHLNDDGWICFQFVAEMPDANGLVPEFADAWDFRAEHGRAVDNWLLRAITGAAMADGAGAVVDGDLAYWQRLRQELADAYDTEVLEAVLLEIAGVQSAVEERRANAPPIPSLMPLPAEPTATAAASNQARVGFVLGGMAPGLLHWAIARGGGMQKAIVPETDVREALASPWQGFPDQLPMEPRVAIEKAATALGCSIDDCQSIDLQFRQCDEGCVWRYFVEYPDCGAVVLLNGKVFPAATEPDGLDEEGEEIRRAYDASGHLKDLRVGFEESYGRHAGLARTQIKAQSPTWSGWHAGDPPIGLHDAVALAVDSCGEKAEHIVACDFTRDPEVWATPWYYAVYFGDGSGLTSCCLVDMTGETYGFRIDATGARSAARRKRRQRPRGM